jgi:D-glycero-D-manno-heptose 1,7-bisphosphate phosphatase
LSQNKYLMEKHPGIFLDRDGTLILDNGYIGNTNNVEFFPFTFEALNLLQKYFSLFIITNQSGISKGIISESDVVKVNNYITETLNTKGITISDTFYCPHKRDDNCNCMKPKPYFINKAAQLYNIDLAKSFIIGDHPSDIECGINAGVSPIYLLSGHGKKHKDELTFNPKIFNNILDASKYIIPTI